MNFHYNDIRVLLLRLTLRSRARLLDHGLISVPDRKCRTVPYYSQWESRKLVCGITHGTIRATDDPLWFRSGASSPEEYEAVTWHSCGIVCLKMILADATKCEYQLCPLSIEAEKHGSFTRANGIIQGLTYNHFCKFVNERFGMLSFSMGSLSLTQILIALSSDYYAIVSVGINIRDANVQNSNRGEGHLVLAIGYDLEKRHIVIHNPSGDCRENQEYVALEFASFLAFFNHRGIIIDTSTMADI